MVFCLSLQEQVLDLQKAKDAQAKEIANLKKTVKKLQRKKKVKTCWFKKIKEDWEEYSDSVHDEAQEQLNEEEMFDVDDLHVEDTAAEVIVQDTAAETITTTETVTAGKEVTTVSGPTTTTIDELTLAQTLVEI
ncbi:hypothetical protein Tco_0243816, partial [Tanacetum coccineum]